MAGYSDGRVTCTDQEIVIRHYYPLGSKHIRYTDIRQVRVAPLGAGSPACGSDGRQVRVIRPALAGVNPQAS
jgi:hypothetical protein